MKKDDKLKHIEQTQKQITAICFDHCFNTKRQHKTILDYTRQYQTTLKNPRQHYTTLDNTKTTLNNTKQH